MKLLFLASPLPKGSSLSLLCALGYVMAFTCSLGICSSNLRSNADLNTLRMSGFDSLSTSNMRTLETFITEIRRSS